jgi:hypothetical protein
MAAEKRGDWTMPPYVPRDLGWDVLTVFASSSHMPPPLINKAFETVANSFHANIQRVKLMILAPVFSSDLAVRLQRYRDIAEFELTGKIIDAPSKDHSRREEILHFTNDRISADAWEAEQALRANANTAWEKLTASLIQRSNPAIATLARYPPGAGLEALISSAVTGTWTAFETMAGDLWEVALNHHPDRLSEMKENEED